MSKIIILGLCLLGSFSINPETETIFQKAINHPTISLYESFVIVKIHEPKSTKEKVICVKSKNLIEAIRAENQYIINDEQAIEILLALEGEMIRFTRKKSLKILGFERQTNHAKIKIMADSIQEIIESTEKWEDVISEENIAPLALELTKRDFLIGQGLSCRNNNLLRFINESYYQQAVEQSRRIIKLPNFTPLPSIEKAKKHRSKF